MWQYNYTPNELYHYGVLGMKWGRRKQRPVFNKVKKGGLSIKQKRALKIGATAVGVALVAYGGYKLSKYKTANMSNFDRMYYKSRILNKLPMSIYNKVAPGTYSLEASRLNNVLGNSYSFERPYIEKPNIERFRFR